MKKMFLIGAAVLALSGCASSSRVAELEEKMSAIGQYSVATSAKADIAVVAATDAIVIAKEAKVEANAAVESVNRMAENCCRK